MIEIYRLSIFYKLTKSLDTVDHQLLLAKLNPYEIRGVSNDCFNSYLPNHNQYVFINHCDYGLAAINCGDPQWSVLGALLLSSYINDLNQAQGFYKGHTLVMTLIYYVRVTYENKE